MGVGFRTMNVIYEGAFVPTTTYGAGIWHERTNQSHIRRKLRATHRAAMIAASNAYCTVFFEGIVAICGKQPLDALTRVKGKVVEERTELNEENLEKSLVRALVKESEKRLLE